MQGDVLRWNICVKNTGTANLEVGDLALPLPMNTDYVWDHTETFPRRVLRHVFIAGHGSFLYWIPVQGSGPILMMQPDEHTSLEFFRATGMDYAFGRESFTAYLHSLAAAEQEQRGTWRQTRTNCRLQPGETATYGFAFRWAKDYEGVRNLLYDRGGIDVHVAPGMVVPRDLSVLIASCTNRAIECVDVDFPCGKPSGRTG